MKSRTNSPQDLLSYLRMQGPTLSSEVVAHFEISRPTLSRRVQELGDAVVTIGKGRSTQLAASHENARDPIPLYAVQENGQAQRLGLLEAIRAGSQTMWYLNAESAPSALLQDEFKDGLYPGWPWFLDDLRPSGFLGRAFGKRMADLFQIDPNPEKWSDLELLTSLVGFGSNLQGNLILGDGRALAEFQKNMVKTAEGYKRNSSPTTYPVAAEYALNEGEELGSSAGGEQPKFTTLVCNTPQTAQRAVIVKFSPKLNTAIGQRWADLLHAEHIANQVLSVAGFSTATTRTFQFEDRVFLESERFDRVGNSGRRGLVSLRALDAAYVGQGNGSWADVAQRLFAGKWINTLDRDQMIRLHCFGQLIANSDMHWGNLSFYLPEVVPFPLAPVYDMLPMFFRPSSTGEVVTRQFEPKLPKPEIQAEWLEMYPLALKYWQQVQQGVEFSKEFQQIAGQAKLSLETIHSVATGESWAGQK